MPTKVGYEKLTSSAKRNSERKKSNNLEAIRKDFLQDGEYYSSDDNTQNTQTNSRGSSPRNIGFFELFKFASYSDKLLIIIGAIFALIEGAGLPLMSIVFGQMSNTLVQVVQFGFLKETSPADVITIRANSSAQTSSSNNNLPSNDNNSISVNSSSMLNGPISAEQFENEMITFTLVYVAIGVGVYLSSVIQISCLQIACVRQITRIKRKFFENVLRQELYWFDKNQSGALASKLNDDVERVRDGLGDQLSLCLKNISSFFSGFAVGFVISWRMTLVLMVATPILALFSAFIGKILSTSVKREQEKYAEAGANAEEVFVAIRTVLSLNGQKSELKAYEKKLQDGKKISITKYIKISIAVGASMFVLYSTYGLALYVATHLLNAGLISPGAALSVLMSVMMAAGALGNIIPPLQTVMAAMSSASLIWSIIDSVPAIDASNERGLKLSKVTANLKFDNVTFCYPLRSTIPVIQNLSLELKQGQTVAICGKTGSGKSTIINLLLRFYDPNFGSVYLDNCKYTELNVAWIRSLIGIVEQEPALFDCSILENIALGATNEMQRTYDKIIAVAKLANAHDFIQCLPEGYQTRCGDRGYQMSGGQKQRIAIARALISDPKILLLDEATSALDSESEAKVQSTLNKARKGRTTIIVAHRLSTIKDADSIVVMDGGSVVEIGKHDELMANKGHYHSLVTDQVFDDSDASNNNGGDAIGSNQEAVADEDYDSDPAVSRGKSLTKSLDGPSSLLGSGILERSYHSGFGDVASGGLQLRRASNIVYDSISKPGGAKLRPGFNAERFAGYGYGYGDNCDYDNNGSNANSVTLANIMALLRPDLTLLVFAIIVGAGNGLLQPVFGLFYAQIFSTLTLTGDALSTAGSFWALMFVAFAAVSMISFFFRILLMSSVIESVTSRLRAECFESIIRQQVGWFDESENSPQRLTTRLASDVPQIKSVINSRLSAIVFGVSSIGAALAIAFAISWQMALLLTFVLPLLLFVGSIQMKIDRRDRTSYMASMEDASRLATEAVEHVKLIQAIGQERHFIDRFAALLDAPMKESLSTARKFALVYGISQSSIYFVYGASFRFGGYLTANELLEPTDMYRVFFAIAFTAVVVGQWGGIGTDMSRVNEAIVNVLRLLNLQPIIDNLSAGGIKPRFKGLVSLQNVHFRYPTRTDTPVLQGLDLKVEPGQTLALVGPSGNGKSTIGALLVRFYDPDQGFVKIDNYDLRCVNLEHLRRNVCIVSQEPILFKASVRENILYGLDASRYTKRDVENAAKTANIHEFIQSLPMGYNTQVGERGTQMSGGQKQRIAIARAIIRNPTILILDEATSALDTESETLVNQALERACAGKTCIKIAHRLSTVRDSDAIAVIEKGSIVEFGAHDQLMALGKKGFYFRLMQKQEITS